MEKNLPNHSKDINIGLLVEINDNSEIISKRPQTVIGENILNVLKQKEIRGFQQGIDNIPTETILSPCDDNLVNYDIMNNPEFSDDVLIPDTPKSKCADLSSDSLSLEDEVFFGPVSFVEKCAAVGAGRISHEAPIDSPAPMSPESSKLFSEAQHMISILENRKTEKNSTKVNQPGGFPSNSLLKTAIANKRRLTKNELSPSKSLQPVADLLVSENDNALIHHIDVNIPESSLLNCQSITSHPNDKIPSSDTLNSDGCTIQTKLNEGELLSHQTKNVLFDNKDSDILIDIGDTSKSVSSIEVELPVGVTGTSKSGNDKVKTNFDTCCTNDNSVNPVLNVANNNKDSLTELHADQDLCERTDSLHLDLPVSLTSGFTNSNIEVLPEENPTDACNIKTEPEESICLDISNHSADEQINQISKSQANQISDARVDQILDNQANQILENQLNQIPDSLAKQISNTQADQIPENQVNKIFDTQVNQIFDNQANLDLNEATFSKSDSLNVDQNPSKTQTSILMNKGSTNKSQPSNSVLKKNISTFKRFSKSPTVLKKTPNEIPSAKNNNLIKTPSTVSNKTPNRCGQSGTIQKLFNGDKSKISHTPKQNLEHGLLKKQLETGSNPNSKQQTMKKDQLKTPSSTSKTINSSLKDSNNSAKASSIKPSSIKSEVKNLTTAGKLNSLCPPHVPPSQPRSSFPSASNPARNSSFKKPETINSHLFKQKQSLLPQRNLSNLSISSQKKTESKSSSVKPVRATQPVVKSSLDTSKLKKNQNLEPNSSDQQSPSGAITIKDSFEKGRINTTPVKMSRNVRPKRILSDCSTPIKSSQQTPLKRKSFLPTPKKSTSSSTSRSSCSNAGSLSSIDSPLNFRSSRDVLSRIDNIDDSSPSCMKSKQTRVQHTPLNKENVSVLNKVRSVWSPVHKANLLSAEEQAIMCTKRTSVYYRK